MDDIKRYIEMASGSKKADLVLKNSWIVDVFNGCIYKGDIAVAGETILGTGRYDGEQEIDCEGLYAAPAFIDSHVHVESSKVVPEIFSRLLVKRGVTCCIADPHEIANVLGMDGIKYMLEAGGRCSMDIYYMLPSCVPAVEFEDNGAALMSEELEKCMDCRNVLGLGEVMDMEAVILGNEDMLKKLWLFKDRIIDGHAPHLSGSRLNAYSLCGIRTDHECSTPEQALEEVKRGMYVMLREGSAAKNIKQLLPAVNDYNFRRFLFCTDDRDITDIYREGSIDNNIRRAVELGMDPVRAITIATVNAAECYGLKGRGAIAPGFIGDMVILKSLKDVEIKMVIRKGRVYEDSAVSCCHETPSSMNIDKISEDIFRVKASGSRVNVIKVMENSIETERALRNALVKDGFIEGIEKGDVLKIAVFERHHRTGKHSVGFIEGLGIKNCSIAQTIAHDSHNIIVVGDNDRDMALAVNRVIDMKGGIAAVSRCSVLEELSLPVAGLMACSEPDYVISKIDSIKKIIAAFGGAKGGDLLVLLSFMSLPVIPSIKITPRGLYDFTEGSFISLCSAG